MATRILAEFVHFVGALIMAVAIGLAFGGYLLAMLAQRICDRFPKPEREAKK